MALIAYEYCFKHGFVVHHDSRCAFCYEEEVQEKIYEKEKLLQEEKEMFSGLTTDEKMLYLLDKINKVHME